MAAFAGALTSAIPVIEKVISAIWPSSSDKNKKKTKQDADAAPGVASLKQLSSDALKSLSGQLSLVANLLESCLPAEDAIVGMQAVLKANNKGQLSGDDKLTLKKEWDNVKKNLKKISDKDTVKSVQALNDTFTRTTFMKVLNADTDGIDEDMKDWSLAPLTTDVDTLYGYLDAVNDVAVQVIVGISQGLTDASAAQAKPAAKTDKAAD
jgi:hypothetical protein